MQIAITGHTGYIGGYLYNNLPAKKGFSRSQGYDITVRPGAPDVGTDIFVVRDRATGKVHRVTGQHAHIEHPEDITGKVVHPEPNIEMWKASSKKAQKEYNPRRNDPFTSEMKVSSRLRF